MLRTVTACSLTLLSCVTLGSERTRLKSTQTVEGSCTDTFTASVEARSAPRARLSVADHQYCATVERQTWAVSTYARMAPAPRLVTSVAVTAALLGGVIGLIAATTPTHPCCTAADRASQESSRIYDAVGIAGVLGVGAAVWALLGVRAESDAPDETTEAEIDRRELVHPYSGAVSLDSGRTVQLTGGGAELDVTELGDGWVRVRDEPVAVGGPVATLLESAPRCASLGAQPTDEALNLAVQCARTGWLLPPPWEAQCQSRLSHSCREARAIALPSFAPEPWPH
jgi:hypothetical protein